MTNDDHDTTSKIFVSYFKLVKSYLLNFKLCEKEVNVFCNVQFILPGVSHQICVEYIISNTEYPGHVTGKSIIKI